MREPAVGGKTAIVGLFCLLLYVTWTGAWILECALEPRLPLLATRGGQVAYWFVLKLLLWVLPSLLVIRLSGKTLRETLCGGNWGGILRWGGGVGLSLGLVALISKVAGHRPLFSSNLDWSLLSAAIISPVVEELAFRGAVLGTLRARYPFVVANTSAALLFLGAHVPGWYFQGCLLENLRSPVGGAFSIFVLGWIFGYVFQRSQSLPAGMLAHGLNNAFNG